MPVYPDVARTASDAADITVGDLLTAPFQVELRGVLMDSIQCSNGLVITKFLDGFGVPQARNLDLERAQRHGLHASPQYLGGRSMKVAVGAFGSSLAALMTLKASLGTAWAPVDADTDADYVVPMAFTLGAASSKYVVFGKPMRAEWSYDLLVRTYGEQAPWAEAALCEFLATDPRIYSLPLQSAVATPGVISGGHGWPHGWAHGWGTATPGSATVVNGGNFPTYPRITFSPGASALVNPTIANATTGLSWQIALTINPGDVLVVDFAEQVARLNNTANRNTYIVRPPSSWWQLQPGSNLIQLAASGSGSATIEWRDAWMI